MPKGLIVLAEDDVVLRETYTAALRKQGFTVMAVTDGQEAVNLLSRTQPRVVVLDVMMPNVDGITACRRIRGVLGRETPILFLTASDGYEVLHDCMEAGGNDFVVKTDRIDSIVSRIGYWAVRAHVAATRPPVEVEPIRRRMAEREAEVSGVDPAEQLPEAQAAAQGGAVADRAKTLLYHARTLAKVSYGQDAAEMRLLIGYAAGLYDELMTERFDLKTYLVAVVEQLLAGTGAIEDTGFRSLLENWGDTVRSREFIDGVAAAREDVDAGRGTAVEPLGLIDRMRPEA